MSGNNAEKEDRSNLKAEKGRAISEAFRNGGGRKEIREIPYIIEEAAKDLGMAAEDLWKKVKSLFPDDKEGKFSEKEKTLKVSQLLQELQTPNQSKLPPEARGALADKIVAMLDATESFPPQKNKILDTTHSQLASLQNIVSKEVGRFALPKSMDNPTA
ncbi:MAG: hypothetical protein PHO48_00830 [Candidatus Gracilibacteria bacterium]|nr:hypothetical protein [Candidatus Gracilibacteria bacterium]MDD5179507.1 hypothetical protein [Candidatus Gracilibacteria bacterium]